ncbi:MAG: AbrB/MazE/SpoVT family DNA-binding domain-containing protein [Spirochaetota bacterium]
MKARLVRIGNSRGIRLPANILKLYHLSEGAELEVEERRDGILPRPVIETPPKLGWAEAYQEMANEAAERLEWSEWDLVAGDGPHD